MNSYQCRRFEEVLADVEKRGPATGSNWIESSTGKPVFILGCSVMLDTWEPIVFYYGNLQTYCLPLDSWCSEVPATGNRPSVRRFVPSLDGASVIPERVF